MVDKPKDFLSVNSATVEKNTSVDYTYLYMSKNPLLNGLSATVYILFIVSIMNWGTKFVPHPNSFMAPVAMISLFTLSAAVMGYVFCYQPIQLYFAGKKKQAVTLFLQTTAVFGCITLLILALLFMGMFSS